MIFGHSNKRSNPSLYRVDMSMDHGDLPGILLRIEPWTSCVFGLDESIWLSITSLKLPQIMI